MQSKFEPHIRPTRSRLEEWRNEIIQMRSLNWPYPKIVEWLKQEYDFKITSEAVRQFCQRRGIAKQSNSAVEQQPLTEKRSSRLKPPGRPVITQPPKTKLFDYNADQPIEIDRK